MEAGGEIIKNTQRIWQKSLCQISQDTQEKQNLKGNGDLEKKEFENNTQVRNYLETVLKDYPNGKILDVGSGLFWKTYIPEEYWGKTSRVDWVDSNDKKNFKKADIEKDGLPFENESFDVIVSKQLFSHLSDEKQSLIEMQRVLKKGGLLINIEYEGDLTDGKTRISIFDPEKIKKQMEEIGFSDIGQKVLDELNTGLKNNLTAVTGKKI